MTSGVTEAAVDVSPDDNVLHALYDRARTDGSATALMVRDGAGFRSVSVETMIGEVRSIGAGLVGAGVEIGDRVAIFGHASVAWALVDYAVWQAGAVGVTIYETSSPDQVAWILLNSGATTAVVENAEMVKVVEDLRGEAPALGKVFTMDDVGLTELKALGDEVADDELDRRAAGIEHQNPATLVYTSGTTGRPKGCVLTHHNLIWTMRQVMLAAPDLVGPGNRTLTFLPLAHVLARVVQLTAITAGVPVAFGGGIQTLLSDLAELKPTWLTVVPRVLEKVHDGAAQKAGTGFKRRIFDHASSVAKQVGAHAVAGTTPSPRLRMEYKVAEAAVYRSLRAAMGGELKYVISGGAPLDPDLGFFFKGVGIEVLEGYGLTETTGPATVHRVGHSKPGTVGPALPGVDVRISDVGEILLSGPLVFKGYWQNDEATADAFEGEWFRTGDFGEVDEDGHVVITGRMKDLIVTAGGKNIAPAPLETKVAAHSLVSHAVVVGDDRPFVSALITLDVQTLSVWANVNGRQVGAPGHLVEDLADDPDLHTELQKAVDNANVSVSRAEGIRAFRVLRSDFTVTSGELTPTLKVRRSIVVANHEEVVRQIYERD
ncbi:MAG: long-chain fatty acid--CoA ligase [Actinomycetia bacterium]|nr:long-chain fatty acid--CoA ligase [Actinomycetes bacterium]